MAMHWTENRTDALASAEKSLKTVANLLGYVKDTKGKPSDGERAIFAAGVVFLYGIWENYVEQLAIELVTKVAAAATPVQVPEPIRRTLEKKSAWELTIHPGWREIWKSVVTVQAIGDEGGEKFGMNTARAGQVKQLLLTAGAVDVFALWKPLAPAYLPAGTTSEEAVNKLVELRGEIVHTGQVPANLRKAHVLAWKDFVKHACESVDGTARGQCKELLVHPV